MHFTLVTFFLTNDQIRSYTSSNNILGKMFIDFNTYYIIHINCYRFLLCSKNVLEVQGKKFPSKELCSEMTLGRFQSVCGETWLRIMYKRVTASKWPTSVYQKHLGTTIHPFLLFATSLKPLQLRYTSVLFHFNFQITLDTGVHHCKIIKFMKSS